MKRTLSSNHGVLLLVILFILRMTQGTKVLRKVSRLNRDSSPQPPLPPPDGLMGRGKSILGGDHPSDEEIDSPPPFAPRLSRTESIRPTWGQSGPPSPPSLHLGAAAISTDGPDVWTKGPNGRSNNDVMHNNEMKIVRHLLQVYPPEKPWPKGLAQYFEVRDENVFAVFLTNERRYKTHNSSLLCERSLTKGTRHTSRCADIVIWAVLAPHTVQRCSTWIRPHCAHTLHKMDACRVKLMRSLWTPYRRSQTW